MDAAVEAHALKFGTFTLKSGRVSPYFFNMGQFSTARYLDELCTAYAHTIIDSGIKFDVIFGPAYKGIPLASVTATKLYQLGGSEYANIGYSFNRKEKKDHGEGGSIVGMQLKGKKIFIIDDVMTAGTAINEAFDIIKQEQGTAVGCVIALDRQETTKNSGMSATKFVSKTHNVPVISIVNFDDIVNRFRSKLTKEQLSEIEDYREKYVPSN